MSPHHVFPPRILSSCFIFICLLLSFNFHLQGPATLKHVAECLAVELSLPALTTRVYRDWDSNTHPSAIDEIALTACATTAALWGSLFCNYENK